MGDQRRSPASLSYMLNRIRCLPGSLRRRPLARLHPDKWGRLATCGGLLNPPRSSENSTPVWGYISLDGAHRSPLIDTSFRKSAFGASPRLASFFQKERYIRRDVFSHFVSQIRLDVGRAPSPAPDAHIRLFQRSESWDGRPDSIFIRRSDRNPARGFVSQNASVAFAMSDWLRFFSPARSGVVSVMPSSFRKNRWRPNELCNRSGSP
jgi:hypothetical protein